MEYVHRELAGTLERALEVMPVVVLTGMRQVGKSTMLVNEEAFRSRPYFTLDDYANMKAARENPAAFLDTAEGMIIDEAQRVREIFLAVKRVVDRGRRPGMFLLSGSANTALLRGVTESLAGRAIYLQLPPMSRREIAGATGSTPFIVSFLREPGTPRRKEVKVVTDAEVLAGGLPPVALGEAGDPALWFTGYEQTYLERDLRDIASVENILGFRDLMKLAALRTAQLLNISGLGRDAHLEAKTAARYLGWMEATYVIRRIQPFLRNKASRVKKSPKLFISDSGMACHLADCRDLSDNPMKGALYETYVLQNIIAIIEREIPPGRVYYWQTQQGREVDFVVELGKDILAIEVKAGEGWSRRDLAGLSEFLSLTPGCRAAVIAHNGEEAAKLGDRMWAIPLGMLLS
ncbi:MAG: ATP-binding protein [Actinobacteria bacterium]|nr:ATP-binding protein [Actinomycetota bacterium]